MALLTDFANTGISLISFLLLNISIFVSAILLTKRYFSVENRLDNSITVGILYIAQIVLYETFLGALHLLTHLNLLVLSLSSFFLVLLICRKDTKWEFAEISEIYQEVRGYLRENRLLQIVLLVCLFIFLSQLFSSLLTPPYEGDSLGNRLPKVIDWLQGHSLAYQESPQWLYPGNAELISLWLIIPFHNDLLVNLQNFPLLFLALLSIYSLCRKIGVGEKWACYGALLFFSAPFGRMELGTATNYLAVSALFLVSLNYIFSYQEYKKMASVLLLSISLGLLLGIKQSGIAYTFVLLLIYLFASKPKIKSLGRDLLILLSGMLLFGGYWYIRNYFLVQNPVAPAEIRVFGKEMFRGPFGFEWLMKTSLIYHGNYLKTSGLLLRALLKWGGIVGFLSLPVIIITSGIALYKAFQKDRDWVKELLLLCLAPLATLYIFLITPFAVENAPGSLNMLKGGWSIRLGMPFLALSYFCFSFLLNYVRDTKLSPLAEISILGIIGLNFLHNPINPVNHRILIFSCYILLIVLLGWQLIHPKITGNKLDKGRICSLSIVVLLLFSFISCGLIKYRKKARVHLYGNWLSGYFGYTDVYKWFDQNVDGKRVLVTGLRFYPFYGPRLNNEVFHKVRDSEDPHKCKDWLTNKKIDFIVMSRMSYDPNFEDFGEFPPMEKNLLLFPDVFISVFSDNTVHVYKTLKTSPEQSLCQ